jgi:hypothetical protein
MHALMTALSERGNSTRGLLALRTALSERGRLDEGSDGAQDGAHRRLRREPC